MISAAISDVGIEKQTNQDSYCIQSAEIDGREVTFLAVADGMGGLDQGEMASGAVIQNFAQHFVQDVTLFKLTNDYADLQQVWNKRILQLNQKIRKYGKMNHLQLGTTMTAMLISFPYYFIVHVGDCRVYQIRDQQICQLTEDQTFIAYQMAEGKMTEAQALNDPRRNMLLQCIGVNPEVEPVFLKGEVKPDDLYLLCSDGFRHQINEQEILSECSKTQASEDEYYKTLVSLTELAKSRQENDNITALLVKV